MPTTSPGRPLAIDTPLSPEQEDRLAALLDETHAARWRELAGRVTKAAEEMVRGGLAAARATAAGNDYAAAYGHLELMRPYATLVGDDFAVVERAVHVEELTHAVDQARTATARNEFSVDYERLQKVKAPTALCAH